jgi:trimethylamine--corrinoid protein Co-methyltransferase
MAALLAGNNLTHDIGYLESGLTTSPEMIVLCDEIISMLRRLMKGISFDAESMALDVIDQVGPGGDFLSTRHTLQNFRQLWRPALFNRLKGSEWELRGGKRVSAHLREKTLAIIDNHTPEPLPPDVQAQVAYILRSAAR